MASHTTMRDRRKPGWFYLDNALIDHFGSEVGAIGIAVYATLARYANKDTGVAFPAYQTLADNLDLSKNTVIAAVRRLVKAGLVSVEQQTDSNGNPIKTNIYTLCSLADVSHESDKQGGAANEPGGSGDGRGGFKCCIRT